MPKTKRDLTELNKLEEYLKKNGIKYTRRDEEHTFHGVIDPISMEEREITMDTHQIVVFDPKEVQLWDVICHYGSYGADQGLLEIMGDIVEEGEGDVVGFLTADEVIERIERKAKNDTGA
jgi:hypothetical protein